jgi:Spy/CpxP family protein refolding chaperone
MKFVTESFGGMAMRAVGIALLAAGLAVATPLAGQEPAQERPAPARMRLMLERVGRLGGPAFDYSPDRLIARREALGLTPEQVQRLESLAQEVRRAREAADSIARARGPQMEQLWREAAPNVDQLRAQAEAILQARQRAAIAALAAAAQAKALLTPEQRGRVAGWADMRRGFLEGRRDRMERMREHMRRWAPAPWRPRLRRL